MDLSPTTRSRRLSRAVLVSVLLMMAVGCAPANTADRVNSGASPAFHVAADMPAQVTTAIHNFNAPLPAGIDWFKKTPSQLQQPKTRYEDGVAEGVVAFYWLCSWEKSYLDSFDRSDSGKEKIATNMLEKWETLPFYKAHFVDPEHGWRRTILEPAELGDPTALRSSFKSECATYMENNPG